ncbi:DUF481 domain-containing protein, partial [Vibrio parahaemolyticus]|nr:DUF481 domain-containing protein [Vibrio parahaemolyticus]
VEYRVDKTDDSADPDKKRIDQWVTTNRYTHHLTEEYTLFGKFNYSRSESKSSDKMLARFIESTAGLAYRPIYNDRLNLLSRYTYLVDFDQLNRDVDYKDEESHIIEVEGIYSLDANWDLGAKYAFKNKHELFTRQSGEDIPVDSKISLYGLSASYRVLKEGDVTGEYHWKTDSPYDE